MLRFGSSSLLLGNITRANQQSTRTLEYTAENRIYRHSEAALRDHDVSFEMNEVVSALGGRETDVHPSSKAGGTTVQPASTQDEAVALSNNDKATIGIQRARRVFNALTKLKDSKLSKKRVQSPQQRARKRTNTLAALSSPSLQIER